MQTEGWNVRTTIELATDSSKSASTASVGGQVVQHIPVARIRPEDGLGRRRDKEGHLELQRSIARFGVLTPITVRKADDGSDDYLLIKGQGRTLASKILGLPTIPGIVVDDMFAEHEKVQQFLVENVARLKMRPVDRALLIHRARQDGEETSSIAARFGVSATTVRRLLAQLDGASQREVAALRKGEVSLSVHAVISRHVLPEDRDGVLSAVLTTSIPAKDLEALFVAIGWRALSDLGPKFSVQRIVFLAWACKAFESAVGNSFRERLEHLATQMPMDFSDGGLQVSA